MSPADIGAMLNSIGRVGWGRCPRARRVVSVNIVIDHFWRQESCGCRLVVRTEAGQEGVRSGRAGVGPGELARQAGGCSQARSCGRELNDLFSASATVSAAPLMTPDAGPRPRPVALAVSLSQLQGPPPPARSAGFRYLSTRSSACLCGPLVSRTGSRAPPPYDVYVDLGACLPEQFGPGVDVAAREDLFMNQAYARPHVRSDGERDVDSARFLSWVIVVDGFSHGVSFSGESQ